MRAWRKNSQKSPNWQEKLRGGNEEEIQDLYSKAYNAKSFLYLETNRGI